MEKKRLLCTYSGWLHEALPSIYPGFTFAMPCVWLFSLIENISTTIFSPLCFCFIEQVTALAVKDQGIMLQMSMPTSAHAHRRTAKTLSGNHTPVKGT